MHTTDDYSDYSSDTVANDSKRKLNQVLKESSIKPWWQSCKFQLFCN